MKINQKQKQSMNKSQVFVSVIALLLSAGGGALAYKLITEHASANKVASTASFEFNEAAAPGWWGGDNIHPASSSDAQTSSEKMPTARRIFAQGTRAQPTGDCFVMYSYWANDSKDLDQALKDAVAPSDTKTSGAFVLKPTDTTSHTIKTSEGDKPFLLHQYDLTGEPGAQMSRGEEFAFVKAGTGYISITGYCKTAEELKITAPVFSAVSFKQ